MTVRLRPGSDKQVRRRHPWVFSGAVASVEGAPSAGAVVRVLTASGEALGWGFFSPHSQIRVRMASWDEAPDAAWLERHVRAAVERRRYLLETGVETLRLIFAEADGLPGLIADRLGPTLVLQSDLAAADPLVEPAAALLREVLTPWVRVERIFERSDGDGRRMEGLAPRERVLLGDDVAFQFQENGLIFTGVTHQKTGHYCDLRDARRRLGDWARGRHVLDAFCHTGGVGLNALSRGAASVCFLDSSAAALRVARDNVRANGFDPDRASFVEGDAFQTLRHLCRENRRFGLVVLDPPKLAARREHRDAALRAYKDLALQGLRLLDEGGHLALFSCSGAVATADLRTAVAFAAWDLGVTCHQVEEFSQSACHPVPLSFPQARYLCGILVQKGEKR